MFNFSIFVITTLHIYIRSNWSCIFLLKQIQFNEEVCCRVIKVYVNDLENNLVDKCLLCEDTSIAQRSFITMIDSNITTTFPENMITLLSFAATNCNGKQCFST